MKKNIEDRVDRIEKIFWVLGVVAVIFGVSGAWGKIVFESTKEELSTLKKNVEEIKQTANQAASEIRKKEEEIISSLNEKAYKQLALVPTGAVMAFNLDKCPDGWKELRQAFGRTVIGVGEGMGLTPRELGQIGGAETHKMTIEELVPHSHKVHGTNNKGTPGHPDNKGMEYGKYFRDYADTSTIGNGKDFNIMQPWVAYLYCEKQ